MAGREDAPFDFVAHFADPRFKDAGKRRKVNKDAPAWIQGAVLALGILAAGCAAMVGVVLALVLFG
jgi:hypothetical protein